MAQSKELNILLLGESGCGKSLFVNSFANYIRFQSLSEARSNQDLTCLIPFRFTITDVNHVRNEVKGGPTSHTERNRLGQSSTLSSQSYVFQMGEVKVRLIDTPGIGSTEGEHGDLLNQHNVLTYLDQLEHLHAIVMVMSNRDPKITERFAYCLKGILTHLEQSAVNNLLFLFTGSEGANYYPGEVKESVELLMKRSLPQLTQDRTYCVDNKAFLYLMAGRQGIYVDPDSFPSYDRAWTKSAKEVKRLLTHIKTLEPHNVRNTIRIHEARRFISIMEAILPEIHKNIDDNAKLLLEDLRSPEMYTQMDLKLVDLGKSLVYCTSDQCRMSIVVEGQTKYYYPRVCCDECRAFLFFGLLCQAFDFSMTCKHCGCAASEHQRQTKMVVPASTPRFLLDDEEMERMKEEDQLVREKRKVKQKMLADSESLMKELELVCAKFLKTHALTPLPMVSGSQLLNPNHVEARVLGRNAVAMKAMERVSLEDVEEMKRKLFQDLLYGKKIAGIFEKDQPLMLSESKWEGELALRFKNIFS